MKSMSGLQILQIAALQALATLIIGLGIILLVYLQLGTKKESLSSEKPLVRMVVEGYHPVELPIPEVWVDKTTYEIVCAQMLQFSGDTSSGAYIHVTCYDLETNEKIAYLTKELLFPHLIKPAVPEESI